MRITAEKPYPASYVLEDPGVKEHIAENAAHEADLTASAPPQFAEALIAASPEPDQTPRADARPGPPPYAIARKPAGSGRSEPKRLQPSEGGSSDHAAAPVEHAIPPPVSLRRADLSVPLDRAASTCRGFRFMSRAPPAFGLC